MKVVPNMLTVCTWSSLFLSPVFWAPGCHALSLPELPAGTCCMLRLGQCVWTLAYSGLVCMCVDCTSVGTVSPRHVCVTSPRFFACLWHIHDWQLQRLFSCYVSVTWLTVTMTALMLRVSDLTNSSYDCSHVTCLLRDYNCFLPVFSVELHDYQQHRCRRCDNTAGRTVQDIIIVIY